MSRSVDNSTLILVVSWTENSLGVLFFILRFITNWRFLHRFCLDLALAALTVVRNIEKHHDVPSILTDDSRQLKLQRKPSYSLVSTLEWVTTFRNWPLKIQSLPRNWAGSSNYSPLLQVSWGNLPLSHSCFKYEDAMKESLGSSGSWPFL